MANNVGGMIPMSVLKDKELSPTEKLVLLALKSFAFGDKKEAYPSKATIGDLINVNPRTVQRAWRALEDKGFIIAQSRGGKGPKSTTNYRIADQVVTIRDVA